MHQQLLLILILAAALLLFMRGPWRYDVVAMLTLLAATVTGVVPGATAFYGFGDPAVVTVAAVFVLSRGLLESGAVQSLTQLVLRFWPSQTGQTNALVLLVTGFSAFMNNVGALAVFLPVSVQLARKSRTPTSLVLMPLAFGSLLGGMITLIGTPPNIIVSDYRAQMGGAPFGIFDFVPVGLGLACAGVALLCLISRHLVPHRAVPASREDLFHIRDYVSEVRVTGNSPLVGRTVREVGWTTDEEVRVLSLIRDGSATPAPPISEKIRADDLLIVQADPATLRLLVHAAGLELVGEEALGSEMLSSEEVSVVEAVITTASPLVRETARSLDLRWHYTVNLLAVARQGHHLTTRLGDIRFQPGDVLLLQGRTGTVRETLHALGCLPLAGRGIRLGPSRHPLLSAAICAAGVLGTALGFLPVHVSLMAAAAALVLTRGLTLREAYEAVDWSVLVLLGAMIPVGRAMETTGAAHLVAGWMLELHPEPTPALLLTGLLGCTMLLSNVMNNAATAVVMAPIAMSIARGAGFDADPFLMAVAVGSSAAFLTPIGHQSNTLVMGPGGYRFGDYWRLGLPLTLAVLVAAVPLLLWWWPPVPAL